MERNHYLVPWRFQPTGFLIAESTGMTSWEHGVLAAGEPGLSLPFLGLQTGQLTGVQVSGGSGGRVCRSACAFLRKPVASPRCSDALLSGRLRGSVVLSFCLDWKREGPVFIKVGGSLLPNKGRQPDKAGSRAGTVLLM